MLLAIIAGLATLIGVALLVVLLMRQRRDHSNSHVVPTDKVKSIDTFGVGPMKQGNKFTSGAAPSVPTGSTASGVPSEMVKDRFIAMGVLAAAVFGTLSVKLWTMQVLQQASFQRKAEENLFTTVYTPAPRGIIYDKDGVELVKNRSTYTVLANADVAEDHDVVQRLSVILGVPFEVLRSRIQDSSSGAQSNRLVADDVSLRSLAYISEHADAFPGITCETRTIRSYPYGALGAHALGYVGTVSEEELAAVEEGRTIESGDIVGKSGVEQFYDSILAGEHGSRKMLTDADGNIQQVVSETSPERGNDIYLTLVAPIQYAADQVLRDITAPEGKLGGGAGTGAAIVCMDCSDGSIVALASFPTFNPASFIGGITQDVWDSYNTEESRYPLMNRAIAGTYPAASTFKAFVSAAALAYDIADNKSMYNCTGTWTGFGEAYPQNCWELDGHGPIDLVNGIAHSCDVVFYEIGKAFYDRADRLGDDCLQQYIETFGFGSLTGIDLQGEAAGRIPTPEWKAEYFKDAPEEAQWMGGDMSNMSIGQGYVLVTPLQLCCGYCGIASGSIFKPHLLKEVRNSNGQTVLSVQPEVLSTPDMRDKDITTVHQGLEDVMTVNNYDEQYFNEVGWKVAGKTGTAEVSGQVDYTWFACYAPADRPKYVAACVSEQGASTGRTTIPMLARVIKACEDYENGTSAPLGSIDATYTHVEYTVGSSARTD